MRIIAIGATGTIGTAVVNELKSRHEIIAAAYKHSDFTVDVGDINSIKNLYEKTKPFDAVVLTMGNVHFAPLLDMNADLYQIGLNHKLMGQVNAVLVGLNYINDAGSFTLTSGLVNHDPIRTGSSAAMVDGAIDAFVKAAAIEMPRGIRINAVSPTVIAEAMPRYASYFRGFKPVPAAIAALAYSKSVEGAQTGQVYFVE